MGAARDHHKAFAFQVANHRLVVPNQWVRYPTCRRQLLMWREARLIRRHAGDLAGNRDHVIQKQRRLAAFDDLDAPAFEVLPIGWRQYTRPAGVMRRRSSHASG